MDTQYRSPREDSRYEEEAAISLPLLDDVNELIEKEKILLEFKVLEQQREASEWKAKYDNLLGKVAENAHISEINENFRILEEVADSALGAAEGPDVSMLIDYIHKIGDHYILDMSGKPASFVVSQITQGSSLLKHYSNVLNAVSFRGCGLKDDSALLLCSKFVSNPMIKGKQEMSASVFTCTSNYHKQRRCNSQHSIFLNLYVLCYIALHNIMIILISFILFILFILFTSSLCLIILNSYEILTQI